MDVSGIESTGMIQSPVIVAFRVDASLEMGSGHVMRCLTLANALRQESCRCIFICRTLAGNLVAHIQTCGFEVFRLPQVDSVIGCVSGPAHAAWLGTRWQIDAEQTSLILKEVSPDWLIVDHYALDRHWESELRTYCRRLMVIDDLADRAHDCDLLLDQTLGRSSDVYASLIPAHCTALTGSQYALLRPDFSSLRAASLGRRENVSLRHILVVMGGVDQHNATGQVLSALCRSNLPESCHITVVMGAQAPFLDSVKSQAEVMPWPTTVRVGVSNMAQLMLESDLAIGAAGTTSWERCCLGLPSLMVILAENQRGVARALQDVGAAILVGEIDDIDDRLPALLATCSDADVLRRLSHQASNVTDGHGVAAILARLKDNAA